MSKSDKEKIEESEEEFLEDLNFRKEEVEEEISEDVASEEKEIIEFDLSQELDEIEQEYSEKVGKRFLSELEENLGQKLSLFKRKTKEWSETIDEDSGNLEYKLLEGLNNYMAEEKEIPTTIEYWESKYWGSPSKGAFKAVDKLIQDGKLLKKQNDVTKLVPTEYSKEDLTENMVYQVEASLEYPDRSVEESVILQIVKDEKKFGSKEEVVEAARNKGLSLEVKKGCSVVDNLNKEGIVQYNTSDDDLEIEYIGNKEK